MKIFISRYNNHIYLFEYEKVSVEQICILKAYKDNCDRTCNYGELELDIRMSGLYLENVSIYNDGWTMQDINIADKEPKFYKVSNPLKITDYLV